MRDFEFNSLVEKLRNALEQEGVFRNCTNCANWIDNKEICNKFKERPPVKIIVKGCEFYDDIPF